MMLLCAADMCCAQLPIDSNDFNQFLLQKDSAPANGFYTYDAFVSAANAYSGFGTTGSSDVQKRELAAFFANVAHETGSKIREQSF
jgi:chitinase